MTPAPSLPSHCGLRIADCGLNNNEPAAGHAAVAVNPQFAIRNPQFPCSLLAGIRIERGARQDWLALAPLHYRSHHAGAVTDILRMVWQKECGMRSAECGVENKQLGTGNSDLGANGKVPSPCGEVPRSGFLVPRWSLPFTPHSAFRTPRSCVLVAVIVYSRSPLSLAARDRATGGRYRLGGCGRVATADLINRELRIISRVVVAPNWRGLGLASRLVAETLGKVGTPYVEALAAMGEMHPMFVRAGMTAYPQLPSKEGERLRAALEAAGLTRADRRSADRLAAAVDALDPPARALAEREIARWARSYLGAKNHRTNQPDRRRMLDLVSRHLDASPVYYLWRAPGGGATYLAPGEYTGGRRADGGSSRHGPPCIHGGLNMEVTP
jgi:GNAT superfamily N-acetyltransferase